MRRPHPLLQAMANRSACNKAGNAKTQRPQMNGNLRVVGNLLQTNSSVRTSMSDASYPGIARRSIGLARMRLQQQYSEPSSEIFPKQLGRESK